MPGEESEPEVDQDNEYVVYCYSESTLSFYSEQTGDSPEEAVRKAVEERGDESLLPLKDGYQMGCSGFHVVQKQDLHTFHHQ
ncbi:hypothetical protein [Haloarcula sp. Atlit-7R]|uniref:hypothetical protein n=1 Tax=Haloarcula sp. Atlit-7R TaxID=2282125 RepID=UPI000EF13D4C|nr:hypothetical protein [Haloarcula sp. Atlit-7R]RLM94398.1 hypothetical protein D3D01_16170 [Haloarcula sp. Atlit-7R]